MRFCDAGPYGGSGTVLTIGGGLTTDMLLYALRMHYFGGVKIDKRITQERFPAGDGPARLVVCTPNHFSSTGAGCRPNSATIPPLGVALEKIGSKLATWETAYRYFLANPNIVQRHELLLWVDLASKTDKVDAVMAVPGSEAPMVIMRQMERGAAFPDRMLFFAERPLQTTSDDNPFSPK